MVAIYSSQSVAPYHSLIPMQPRPCGDTGTSPSEVVRMCFTSPLEVAGFQPGQAPAVKADLRAEQFQALPLGSEGLPPFFAVPLEQLDAFGLARARPDELGVALHIPHRHPGGAQLGQQRQPVQVAVAVPAPAVAAALDRGEQADALVPAQGVLGQAAFLGRFAYGPGRHDPSLRVRARSNTSEVVSGGRVP